MTQGPFFVVGCARSGTTLLQVILDGHSRLAVPPESYFIARFAPGGGFGPTSGLPLALDQALRPLTRIRRVPPLAERLEMILASSDFEAWHLDPDLVRRRVARDEPRSHAELIDAIFSAYASAKGKLRWGDKTPWYVVRIGFLARLFPDAQFVQVIRDGRAVATSLAEQPFAVDGDVTAFAFQWRAYVAAGRRAGRRLGPGRYLEVRLEDLVADPPGVVERVCGFLGEGYESGMLDYPARVAAGGAPPEHHRHLLEPPTVGLRDWRRGLDASQRHAVESVCAPLLRELGYPRAPRSTLGIAHAWSSRLRGAMRRRMRRLWGLGVSAKQGQVAP